MKSRFNPFAFLYLCIEPKIGYVIKLNSLNCDVNNEELYFSFKSKKGEEYKFYTSSIGRLKDNCKIVDLDNFFDT